MVPLIVLVAFTSIQVLQVDAGQCWTEINSSGKCGSMVSSSMIREECCSTGSTNGAMMSAFVDRDLSSGEIFKMKMFKGGIPCEPCKATCSSIKCDNGKVCRESDPDTGSNVPTCVCDASCSKKKRKLGQVCGSDGKTYKNMCRMMRKKCTKNVPSLTINHFGQCQGMKLRGPESCSRMDCPYPRTCLLDQKSRPHCVKCSIKCRSNLDHSNSQVCGSDGNIYKSNCHLRQAACSSGKTISIQEPKSCNQTLSTFVLLDEE